MPTNQQSNFASTNAVLRLDRTYTSSVDAARYQDYTASVYAVIQPDRYIYETVYTVPEGSEYITYAGDVYAYFTPITPDRFITATVYAYPTTANVTVGYTATVSAKVFSTFNQSILGSVYAVDHVDVDYTASLVPLAEDVDWYFTGSVKTVPTPPDKVYTATVDCKALDVDLSYSASVRPFNDISPAEHQVRDTDQELLVSYVKEKAQLDELISSSNDRITFLLAEIARLLDLLDNMPNKPSCRLSSVSPSTELSRTGGDTMFLFGYEFIATCTVQLTQDLVDMGDFTPIVDSENQMYFTTPDFSGVIGLDLDAPISIQVHNPDGEDSEILTFTLAAA